jgi:hypothetical protein
MSTRIERISNHAIHSTLNSLERALGVSLKSEPETSISDELDRLSYAQQFIKTTLVNADPLLISFEILDAINSNINGCNSSLQQFVESKNPEFLNHSHADMDRAISTIGSIKTITSPKDVSALHIAIKAFSISTNQTIKAYEEKNRKLETEYDEMRNQLQQLSSAVDKEQGRIDQILSVHQAQFAETQDSKQKAFNEITEKAKDNLEIQRDLWDSELTKVHKEHSAKLELLAETTFDRYEEFEQEKRLAANRLVEAIEELRDKAKDIVGIIAGTGMAGGYQKDANVERRAYVIWNRITIGGLAGLILSALAMFTFAIGDEAQNWFTVLSRFGVVLTFGVLSAYTGGIARKHLENEREHRHKQIALESVNSFIEDLSPEEQQRIKQKIADEFFTPERKGIIQNEKVPFLSIPNLIEIDKLLNKK